MRRWIRGPTPTKRSASSRASDAPPEGRPPPMPLSAAARRAEACLDRVRPELLAWSSTFAYGFGLLARQHSPRKSARSRSRSFSGRSPGTRRAAGLATSLAHGGVRPERDGHSGLVYIRYASGNGHSGRWQHGQVSASSGRSPTLQYGHLNGKLTLKSAGASWPMQPQVMWSCCVRHTLLSGHECVIGKR